MFLLTKSVMSRMLPFVTASPMCCESRIAMSKSVFRAANCVNIASCQFALGTVLTLMVTFGRSLVYSLFAKSSSAWAGGHSNQMKLRVSGSSVSVGTVAGALGPAASPVPPPLLSPPPPQAAMAVAITTAAAASRTRRPGRDPRPARFAYRICSPASWVEVLLLAVSEGYCGVLFLLVLLTVVLCCWFWCGAPDRRVSPGRRDVLGLHELEEPFGAPLAAEPALLGAAEGRSRVGHQPAVQPDHAALDAFGEPQTAGEVAGVQVADEAELCAVDHAQHLVLLLETDDRGNRTEDLLVQNAGMRRHVDQHGRRIEAARPLDRSAAQQGSS